MRFIVLTGTSGAGKMAALHYFSDIGYFTVDNLPPDLLPSLADTCERRGIRRVLAVVDARAGRAVCELPAILDGLAATGRHPELLFLDASDEVLVRRFKETRRPHPAFGAGKGTILDAIHAERSMLAELLGRADKIIDTSHLTPGDLRAALAELTHEQQRPGMTITVESFGFKYGIPMDADLVFDVRFLINPHYIPELKPLTGRSPEVVQYIRSDPLTKPFLKKMIDFISFTLPHYQREGKAYLTIAIGCTGGQHRSVTVAEELAKKLRQRDYRVAVFHRDVERALAAREEQP
jgi:UPF0042 nucleotide-binding protein